ncbi:Citrinin synthesis mpl7 [Hyphodiscus hymeniophilus]|uniref:Citrinin synthesis mpl7 n=1 Tax=Hyphodiscus hymeniophilus TaxID=353542 RepID=A0A9P6SQD9_9HELO|nr:Citrinin synthesis mpl7 [Hyphodiscus hymeniophilus]
MNVWVHASPKEYDDWEVLGNTGWNWRNLKAYFEKSETFQPIDGGDAHTRKAYEMTGHGRSGPLETTVSNDSCDSNKLWNQTWNNLGVKTVLAGSSSPLGTQYTKSSISATAGTRSSSVSSYYQPNMHRKNLHLLPRAVVSKVNFTKGQSNLTATSVDFSLEGERYTIQASKEVIICAGTVQSPMLLELSGIGTKSVLDSQGIETLVPNPGVGENLQDHPFTISLYEVVDTKYSTDQFSGSPDLYKDNMAKYSATRSGFFASGSNCAAYVSLDQTSFPSLNRPDFHAAMTPGLQKQHDIQLARLRDPEVPNFQVSLAPSFNPAIIPEPKPQGVKDCISVMQCVAAPFSRGSVHIQSSDPEVHPRIDPRYLDHPLDKELLATVSQYGPKLMATQPLSQAIEKCIYPAKPATTDEEHQAFSRKTLGTFFHPIGTCSMLPRLDGGVVDSRLIVYGTTNLRVVDASVLPLHISGNIQATVYAVAERAADLIKMDRQNFDVRP